MRTSISGNACGSKIFQIRLYVVTDHCTILAQPITRTCAYIYIKVPYFTSFRFPASSTVGLGLGLIVGLGTVLVLFLLHFFFPMYVKKTRGLAVRCSYCAYWVTGSNPMHAIIFFTFLKFFLQVFCKSGLLVSFSLKVSFRVRVNFNMRQGRIWGRGAGPQASHQKGASHQTLQFLFRAHYRVN